MSCHATTTISKVPGSKVAAITGAAQGIGRSTAELLASRGYRIAIIDLHPASATVAAIESAGGTAFAFAADITNESAVAEFAQQTLHRYGRIDTLVNNAGISHICPAEEIPAADYRRVLEVNLVAPFLLAKAFAPTMLAQRSGSIINVASIAGLFGVADRAAYNASKHGLVGLTRTLAAEWGGQGIRVNAVCPGWVKTEMDAADQANGTYSDDDITHRVPMGRFATPGDIAHAIAFLADSAESAFVNGHTLAVDGGWTADASWESLRLSKR
jgi:NAD(P)-dependent dehydrogenase (short-subunit alcohol dehydrogenase family)